MEMKLQGRAFELVRMKWCYVILGFGLVDNAVRGLLIWYIAGITQF